MTNFKYIIFSLLLVSLFASCDDDNTNLDENNYDVIITFNTPSENAVINHGDDVHADVTFERANGLTIHDVIIELIDSSGAVEHTLVDVHADVAGTYNVHKHHAPSHMGNYTLKATTRSHDGDEVTASRAFKVMGHGHGHGDSLDVSIRITNPMDASTHTANTDIPVAVEFIENDGGIIHHVKIELVDGTGTVVQTLDSGHKHKTASYNFTGAVNIANPGAYKLKATVMSMDMSDMKHMHHSFTVN